jgi:hypothetical protein
MTTFIKPNCVAKKAERRTSEVAGLSSIKGTDSCDQLSPAIIVLKKVKLL